MLCLLLLGCDDSGELPPAPTIAPTAAIELARLSVVEGGEAMLSLVSYQNEGLTVQWSIIDLISAETIPQFNAVLTHHVPPSLNGNWFSPVALDGLVFVTHPDVNVNNLTRQQLQALFSSDIDHWNLVGGENQAVTLFTYSPQNPVRQLMAERVLRERRVSVNAEIRPDQAAMLAAVAETPGAIGFIMHSMVATSPLQPIAVDGIAATPVELGTQAYPLTVPLYWLQPDAAEPSGELRGLLAWLQSADGQAALGERFGRIR